MKESLHPQKDFLLSKRWSRIIILVVIVDLIYSFLQHLHLPMDGDLGGICLPNIYYARVLEDPLGLSVLLNGEQYLATNRFFAHYSIYFFFKYIPDFFQNFFSPINSIYWSSAIFKIFVQGLILFLLSSYVRILLKLPKSYLPIIAVLLIPFIQNQGYSYWMGIIDSSITYTFFYAWPISLCLLFFFPYFKHFQARASTHWSWPFKISWFILAFCLPFGSPIAPPILILAVCLLFLWQISDHFQANNKIFSFYNFIRSQDQFVLFSLIWIVAWSAYSFYIGQFNLDNSTVSLSLEKRYALLFKGILKILTDNLGFAILVIMVISNIFIMKKWPDSEEKRTILKISAWVGLFIFLYVILLPLGGYRPYRPYILRRDTVLPITLLVIMIYGASTFHLLSHFTKKYRRIYLLILSAIFVIFTIADEPTFSKNSKEKDGLQKMATTNAKVLSLAHDQLVFAWDNLPDTTATRSNAALIHQLGITDTIVLYYNEPEF